MQAVSGVSPALLGRNEKRAWNDHPLYPWTRLFAGSECHLHLFWQGLKFNIVDDIYRACYTTKIDVDLVLSTVALLLALTPDYFEPATSMAMTAHRPTCGLSESVVRTDNCA